MTADDFTDAARAEAERKYNEWVMSGGTGAVPLYREKILRTPERKAFRAGAEWAREHLAAHDAQIKRDAAREALDGLASAYADDPDIDEPEFEREAFVIRAARHYRDTHYPEETP